MDVTDPVCGMRIESDKAAGNVTWQGRSNFICSPSYREQFRLAPERYAEREQDRESATRGKAPAA